MKTLINVLEGHEILLALVLVALFAAYLIYLACDGRYKARTVKKQMADAERLKERTEERDEARDTAFELRLSLEKAQARIRELEHKVYQLKYDIKQLEKWGGNKNV